MNKKLKITIPVLLVVVFVATCVFFNFSKKEEVAAKENNSQDTSEMFEATGKNLTEAEKEAKNYTYSIHSLEDTFKTLDDVESITIEPTDYKEYKDNGKKLIMKVTAKNGKTVSKETKKDIKDYIEKDDLNCSEIIIK